MLDSHKILFPFSHSVEYYVVELLPENFLLLFLNLKWDRNNNFSISPISFQFRREREKKKKLNYHILLNNLPFRMNLPIFPLEILSGICSCNHINIFITV